MATNSAPSHFSGFDGIACFVRRHRKRCGLVLKITDHARLLHKMRDLVIDQIDFKNLSIQDAVRSLATTTKRCDPQHEGINFVLTRSDLLRELR